MPKVHFVKKARKDNSVCKKGESYHWWEPYRSPKRYSKEYPRQSQLCGGKKSEIFAAQEALEDATKDMTFVDAESAYSELETVRQECVDRLREIGEEYQDGVYNMPDGLQQGETAMNMEEMAQSLDMTADTVENVDIECSVEKDDYKDDDDGFFDKDAYLEECQMWLEGVASELVEAANEVEILF